MAESGSDKAVCSARLGFGICIFRRRAPGMISPFKMRTGDICPSCIYPFFGTKNRRHGTGRAADEAGIHRLAAPALSAAAYGVVIAACLSR